MHNGARSEGSSSRVTNEVCRTEETRIEGKKVPQSPNQTHEPRSPPIRILVLPNLIPGTSILSHRHTPLPPIPLGVKAGGIPFDLEGLETVQGLFGSWRLVESSSFASYCSLATR
ncbi:hypothetical protein P691DRAFT_509388 [Macrolepiota fuliginosa MF-IS2]|uniref:Uncharacterized protein n=1 Tax=Macrolepiota fuliginosa MF-IS2 TaxID=1400762 RepID=A0A9P5X1V1_9AGAR|nr:hypothetical protein P691DRAFT_509388 [Macrolepiota fuliginosa MF-IS2]